jgi:hypothetical protein
MKKLLVYLLLMCSFSQVVYGDDAGGVVLLEKNSPAPYSGFLFTQEKAERVRLLDLDYKQELKKNEFLTTENVIYLERIKLKDEQIDLLAKRVVDDKDDALWSKIGFFLIGSVLTGAIAIGVSRLK